MTVGIGKGPPSDFHETRQGVCRILAPLSHRLAETGPIWRAHVAPVVERVAHLLADGADARVSGRSYAVTTGPTSGNVVRLRSFADMAAAYATHPEPKSVGPDGRPAGRRTVGLLGRRAVTAKTIRYIGKEANELEAVEEGLVHDLAEVLNDYGSDEDRWDVLVRPAMTYFGTEAVAAASGLSRRTVQRLVAGRARPNRSNTTRLEAALDGLVRAELERRGGAVPREADDRLRALLASDGRPPAEVRVTG